MSSHPIAALIGLPPEETVAAFEARDTLRATVRWHEMWEADHARAFTVAKVAKLDLLAEIQASLADVIANGGTLEQWQANLEPYLRQQGWWGEVRNRALTGTDDAVNVGPRRLRTIYDTNLRVSRAAGRWQRIQALKQSRPFLRYTAVMDARTRPLHREWHGTILPVDHPWWDEHFPPCGWFCRCAVRQLSQRDLDRNGWSVGEPPKSGPPKLYYPAGRGEPVAVPAGIDPGFAYNPGKASMAAIADKAVRALDATAPRDLAVARAVLDDFVQSRAYLEALSEPGVNVPVMVLDDRLAAAIAAEARVVRFSSDSYLKQSGRTDRSRGHGDLTIADYRELPGIGAAPDRLFVSGAKDRHTILVKHADGRWYVAVLKTAANGTEIYLQSFRRAAESDVARIARRDREVQL